MDEEDDSENELEHGHCKGQVAFMSVRDFFPLGFSIAVIEVG